MWTRSVLYALKTSGFANLRAEPEDDTELSQNSIEFAIKLLSKSPATIISVAARDRVEFFFMFTLKVLNGKEPLPKAAAADFWVGCLRFQESPKAD